VKPTKNLSQYSRSPSLYSKLEPPEYEVGVLTTRPRHSVSYLEEYLIYVDDEYLFMCSTNKKSLEKIFSILFTFLLLLHK
jgi:hypothetical protein